MKDTRNLVFTALMCALCCITTMVIKLPTPTMGYIHPGDGLVLLSGLILEPLPGALAAGLGSMLADLFSGYIAYAPATFVIKALTAAIAGVIFKALSKLWKNNSARWAAVIVGSIFGELFMVMGYFLYEVFLIALSDKEALSQTALTAAIASAGSGIPFNLVQGIFGILIAAVLYPVITKLNANNVHND